MYSQLQLVHDQELLDSYQRLHARFSTCTKKVFLQWQQATGLTYSKYALMLNESLLSKGLIQPISQFCHDWMHGVLQGTAPVVLHHMLATLSEPFQSIHDLLSKYFEVWTLPKGWKSQHLPKLFLKKNQNAQGKATKFSCLASEILGIFPILRHFLCTIVEPKALCPLAIQAFYAMAHVIDQCHGGVQWKRTTRESLLLAVEAANQTFRAAWPDAPMIRKWHWHLHLPDTMARFGMLPSCFTAERKHKTISAFATKLTKTSHFEKHLLQQIVPNEISTLQELHLFPEVGHLIKPQKAQAKKCGGPIAILVHTTRPCRNCFLLPVIQRWLHPWWWCHMLFQWRWHIHLEDCQSDSPCQSVWLDSHIGPTVDHRGHAPMACQLQSHTFHMLDPHGKHFVSSSIHHRWWNVHSAAALPNLQPPHKPEMKMICCLHRATCGFSFGQQSLFLALHGQQSLLALHLNSNKHYFHTLLLPFVLIFFKIWFHKRIWHNVFQHIIVWMILTPKKSYN